MLKNLQKKLPKNVNPWVKKLAWFSLTSQIAIVVTGGAVRLTASGLGCPSWPKCTPDSLTTTTEMGIHGVIEFGNRILTFLLAAIAILTLISLSKFRKKRKDLWFLALFLLAGIPAQAILGGITVLTNLNPWVVGLHFLLSTVLITLATLLVQRTKDCGGKRELQVPKNLQTLIKIILVNIFVAVILGVMVTGSGPHAGDALAKRNGLDPYIITRIHIFPVYIMVILTLFSIFFIYRKKTVPEIKTALIVLFSVQIIQGLIGYTQHFLGLPIILVALHMLGACLLVSAGIYTLDITKKVKL